MLYNKNRPAINDNVGNMLNLNVEFLSKCIDTLELSYKLLKKSKKNSINYEMYRNYLVKSFEMTLEQSEKLLRKVLTPFFSSKKAIDQLMFKDLFRRNNIAHDYGEYFAEETLSLIKDFIKDAKKLKHNIENA